MVSTTRAAAGAGAALLATNGGARGARAGAAGGGCGSGGASGGIRSTKIGAAPSTACRTAGTCSSAQPSKPYSPAIATPAQHTATR